MNKKLFLIAGSIVCFFSLSSFAGVFSSLRHWDLNDVTIIYPLPESDREDKAMVKPLDSGAHGALLPKEVAALFPKITPKFEQVFPAIRLMSTRMDPCGMVIDGECKIEIRLVWQQLLPKPKDTNLPRTTTVQAFHTFYFLNKQEYYDYAKKLDRLLRKYSPSTRGLQLNIHPAFVRDGIDGAFGREYRKLLLETVGVKKIHRIAAIGFLEKPIFQLAFEARDFVNGKWVQHQIAGIKEPIQAFSINEKPGPYSFALDFFPVPTNIGKYALPFLQNSVEFFKKANKEQVFRAARTLGSFQNPKITDREKVNCAGCHVAPNSERWIRVAYPNMNLFNADYRYKNPNYNLKDVGVLGWGLFALSYQRGTLTTHTRAIAESAETAEWLNQN